MVLDSPIHVHWELTKTCNLKCIHCYQQDDNDAIELTEKQVIFIAEKLIKSKIFQVTLTGGEPFGRSYLYSLIKLFNNANISPHITTNGTLLNHTCFNWLEEVNVSVQISLDSHIEERHNKIRRNPNAFNLALNGIKYLKDLNKNVSIAFCANRHNYKDIEGVIQLSILNNVDSVVIGEVLPFFGDVKNKKGLAFTKEEYKSFIEYCIFIRNKYKAQISVFINTERGFLFSNEIEHAPCSALDRDLAILYNGFVSPCPFIRNSKYFIGNILDEDLPKIWNSKSAMFFRENKHKGCNSSCTFFGMCMSGCKADIANNGENINTPDSNCYQLNYNS